MKIKKIDRNTTKFIRDALNDVLAKFAKTHGLNGKVMSGSFSPDLITFKVQLQLEGADPVHVTHYKMFQKTYDLPELGTLIRIKNNVYSVEGFLPKKQKNSILIRRTDGKEFATTADVVKRNIIGGKTKKKKK